MNDIITIIENVIPHEFPKELFLLATPTYLNIHKHNKCRSIFEL